MAINWARISPKAAGQSVYINVASKAELWSLVRSKLSAGEGYSLATVNLDHLIKFRTDAAFLRAYSDHTYVVADGNPIVWASKLGGDPVSLVPGSETIVPICEIASDMNKTVAFLGSTEHSLAGAETALTKRFPNLKVVAKIVPPMGFDPNGAEADAFIAELGDAGADICFLALGAPKQEILAARICENTEKIAVFSIGAGLDFLSGVQKRAPKIARIFAMEWLWRMVSNPKRLFVRYAKCFAILPAVFILALRSKRMADDKA